MGDESSTATSLRKSSLTNSKNSSTASLIEKDDDDIIVISNVSTQSNVKQHNNLNEIVGPGTNLKGNHVISSVDGRNGAQDLTRYFNLGNFKCVSLCVIFMFIFYHGYLNSFYGE
jgi:hypothetical protein